MGRKGKRKCPTVEMEATDRELDHLKKLVGEAIGPTTLRDGGFPESDLEHLLIANGLDKETWFEVYWSG
jgi:hypothetical protein